jgi:conjugal transfer pilus assembly protein TraV
MKLRSCSVAGASRGQVKGQIKGFSLPLTSGTYALQRFGQPALASVITLLLAGCMNLSGLDSNPRYGCRAPEGVHCQSVSGTYANTATRMAALKVEPSSPATKRGIATEVRTADLSTNGPNTASKPVPVSTASASSASSPATPLTALPSLRSAPRILRLWFKPWEDNDRDLYDEGYVFVQVDNGQWLIEHAQQRIRSAYAPVRPPAQLNKDSSTRPLSGPATGTAVPPPPSTSGLFGNKPVFPVRPSSPLPMDSD